MNQQRIEAIYGELSQITVQMAADPRQRGAGYVAAIIKEITDAIENVNEIEVEIERDFAKARDDLRLKKLEFETLLEIKLTSPEIQRLEISYQEKIARAKLAVEEDIRVQTAQAMREAGQEPPNEIPTIRREIVDLENQEEDLRALKRVVGEKRAHLKGKDSAVRLQNNAIATEMGLFRGPPQEANSQRESNPPRRGRRRATGQTEADPSWNQLSGDEAQAEHREEQDQT